ncbi:MAG: patatin-like phospholipase family protein [Sphaerochaeta sp.]|jgi:NTE family protein|uniref:patatin-like phospholipase family protein n=1 Tax=Sphaerochaeta sp. TaxID=1972642 RepID=UPI002A36774A|nr:patatin-like phospholipase family protein [Sphaerochaeta sp.]MDX9823740.1 patatin-like phospholipase family protein [Sphaerochaeta sp.]
MKRALFFILFSLLCVPLAASKPTVVLVLSGGGARGLAHIAVLEALEAEGIPIDMVLGASMGSLVGGLYSSGYTPKEIRRLLEETDLVGLFSEPALDTVRNQNTAFSYMHDHVFSLGFGEKALGDGPSLIGDQKILELLGYLFAKYPNTIDFDDLPIPFRCVSADALTGERIVYESGSLVSAIRSSISIPLVFSPYPYEENRLVVDGGVVDNLPIALARSLGADIVIASDVNALQFQSYEELENLSAMAVQTVFLLTQEKATMQHPLADLLFLPDLRDINSLDFTKPELIIERGRQAVEARRDELAALAEKIGSTRGLAVLDSNRNGAYSLQPTPTILQIAIQDLSLSDGHQMPQAKQFSSFLGRKLDKQTAEELNLKLREIRKANALASLSYEMAPGGTLLISGRGFGKLDRNISLGLQSDAGFSNALPSSLAWYRADVFLDAYVNDFWNTELSLLVNATLGQKTSMQIALSYPFAFTSWGQVDVKLGLFYGSGSFSTLSTVVNAARTAPLDRAFHADLALDLRFNEIGLASLMGSYHLVSLHDNRFADTFLAFPELKVSLLYNSLRSRFTPGGYRLDVLASIGYLDQLLGSMRLAWNQRFALTYLDSLGYDLHLSLIRRPYPLLDSYADLGIVEGIPGYSPLSLRRDALYAGVTWQHRLNEVLGYPTYSKVILRTGVLDVYDPYTAQAPASNDYFSDITWDMGLGVVLGLVAPLGEILISFGANLAGFVTLAVGVY